MRTVSAQNAVKRSTSDTCRYGREGTEKCSRGGLSPPVSPSFPLDHPDLDRSYRTPSIRPINDSASSRRQRTCSPYLLPLALSAMDTDADRQHFTQVGQDGAMSPEGFWEEHAAAPIASNDPRPPPVPTPHNVQFMSQEWLASFARLQQGHAELLARQTASQNLQVETLHRQLDLHASLNNIITGYKAQYMVPELQLNNQPVFTQPLTPHSENIKRESGQQVHHQAARAFPGYEQYNSNGNISQNANYGMDSTTFAHGNTMLSGDFDHLMSYNNLPPTPTPGRRVSSNEHLSVPQVQTTSQPLDQETGDIPYQYPPGFSSPPSLVGAYQHPTEHSPASLGKRRQTCGSPLQRYVSNMRSDLYLRDINQLSSMLPRAHLEKVLADLAAAERGAAESGPPVSKDLVKPMLLKQIHQQHTTVASKFAMAIPSLALHTEADMPLGHIGLFQALPVECKLILDLYSSALTSL